MIDSLVQAGKLLFSGDREVYYITLTSLKFSLSSVTIAALFSLPLGFVLGFRKFRARKLVIAALNTLMALPTVFIGLVVYAFLTHRGPMGGLGLLFTLPGIAIGQAILALPIVIGLSATAVESMDQKLRITIMSMGANRRQLFLSSLWESRHGILAGAVAAYGRVMTEVGISMMVGGNIKWHTRTITTAIALETNKGQFGMGVALGLVLLAIAFCVNVSVSFLRRRC